MKKRMISLVLVLAMALSLLGGVTIVAQAEESNVIAKWNQFYSVTKNSPIKPNDGLLKETATLTSNVDTSSTAGTYCNNYNGTEDAAVKFDISADLSGYDNIKLSFYTYGSNSTQSYKWNIYVNDSATAIATSGQLTKSERQETFNLTSDETIKSITIECDHADGKQVRIGTFMLEGTSDSTPSTAELQSISVKSAPYYYEGDTLSTTGWLLTAIYDDGNTKEVEPKSVEFAEGSSMTEGQQTVVVSYGEKSVNYNITVTAAPAVPTYAKVTSEQKDWSGQYLLVYESSENEALVWTGIDESKCYESAKITDGKIKLNAKASITIETMKDGYKISVDSGTNAGKYIYGTSGSNKTNFGTDSSAITIEYDNENECVNIVSNTSVMRFNKADTALWFRFFKSATYDSQQPIQLYKLVTEETTEKTTLSYGVSTTGLIQLNLVFNKLPENAEVKLNNTIIIATEGKYIYKVAAKNIADDVTLSVTANGETVPVYASDGKTEIKTVSVQKYLDQQIASPSGVDETKLTALKNLVQAMSDYGYYSAKYFGVSTTARPQSEATITIDDIKLNDVESYKGTYTNENTTVVEYKGASLLLESGTKIRQYFKIDETKKDDVKVTVTYAGGEEQELTLTKKSTGSYYYVDVDGIAAKDLNRVYTFTVTVDGTSVCEVKYCALSYVVSVLSQSTNTDLQNAAKALYIYYFMADEYFN